MEYSLLCTGCARKYDSTYDSQLCAACSGILEVAYHGSASKAQQNHSFWDYEHLLPSGKYRHYEVGFTRLAHTHDSSLYLKMELQNPTHSFKDRGSVVEVAKAHEYGYEEVVCASTGNMAYSVAYYAKLYGIKATIFISKDANRDKLREIRETHDAKINHVKGDFTMAQRLAEQYAKRNDAFLAGDYCYRKEGQSTIAHELLAQLPDARYVFVPVGNATLLSGILKVFRNIKEGEPKAHVPSVIAVQASSCKPLAKAFTINRPVEYVIPRTKADAIAVGLPTFGERAIADLRALGGSVLTVSDKEMATEQKSFYDEYGIIAELAGVAPMAAYGKLRLGDHEKAVAIISGGNV